MACGMLAMQAAGIKVDRYDAYEIDKYAVKVASHNFPMIEQRGDVFAADFTEFEGFDYVVGGSPCTYWSIAQKNNRETEASGLGWELFSQYVRAVREAKPRFFLYENNKSMSKEIKASITETFGFEPILINSALVSAQNRNRLYWVGKREEDGTYSKVQIEQPDDRGILLRDILDSAVAWQEKSYCLTATEWKGSSLEHSLQKHVRTQVAESVRIPEYGNPDKSRPIEALYASHAGTGAGSLEKRLFSDNPSKQQNDLIAEMVPADSKTQPIYEVLNGLITIKDKQYPIKLADGYYIIRKLTVNECKRLQTVPEGYEFNISNSQAYKCLGNGWTVDVIAHILSYIKNATPRTAIPRADK